VGYGQKIKQSKYDVDFWTRSLVSLQLFFFFTIILILCGQWSRQCPDKKFCFTARPADDSADAMVDLVGGDWNNDYWGSRDGTIFGLVRLLELPRAEKLT
jgi:hypothetical protein